MTKKEKALGFTLPKPKTFIPALWQKAALYANADGHRPPEKDLTPEEIEFLKRGK